MANFDDALSLYISVYVTKVQKSEMLAIHDKIIDFHIFLIK
jgi:hypothetical protein